MKKLLFASFFCIGNYSVFAEETSMDMQKSVPEIPPRLRQSIQFVEVKFNEDDPILQVFSPKAIELLQTYVPRGVNLTAAVQSFYYPPHNKEKHYNEEYRSAWEEIYREVALDGVYAKGLRLKIYSPTALSEIASTNSISMLLEVYEKVSEKNKDASEVEQKGIEKKQKETLDILFKIDAQSVREAALKAKRAEIVALLDAAEQAKKENKIKESQP